MNEWFILIAVGCFEYFDIKVYNEWEVSKICWIPMTPLSIKSLQASSNIYNVFIRRHEWSENYFIFVMMTQLFGIMQVKSVFLFSEHVLFNLEASLRRRVFCWKSNNEIFLFNDLVGVEFQKITNIHRYFYNEKHFFLASLSDHFTILELKKEIMINFKDN